MTVRDSPIDGAQAASRTQSECPSSLASSTHSLSSLQIRSSIVKKSTSMYSLNIG